jgi:signal transduction histidine kinase
MIKLRLRTKFLLLLLVVSAIITTATVLLVGRSVRAEVQKQLSEDLRNSVVVFRGFQRQREIMLASSAELLADVPTLKALMTTQDAATIQDASTNIWRSAPSDIFVLANRAGKVVAIHTATPGITRTDAQELLNASLRMEQPSFWWYATGHLYQVFLRPIYFGRPEDGSALGMLGVGHEISEDLAREVSRIASSEVAFLYGKSLIVSTLNPMQEPELARILPVDRSDVGSSPAEIRLGGETFFASTVRLNPNVAPFVQLTVLKSYDKASLFLDHLNRRLLELALLAVLAGTVVVFFFSFVFTKPLTILVAGVRALEQGNFVYPLMSSGTDETADLTVAFERMRKTVQQAQSDLVAAERLATIGRTASSISHDLRHPLTAVVANAEFLCDHDLTRVQRDELYKEIQTAVDQMTDLVDSLLEFSQARESLRRVFGPIGETVERARSKVMAHPEFHSVNISIDCKGRCETWFDERKVERALVNMLRNACEFVPRDCGTVCVTVREGRDRVEIRIADNGPGVPGPIRETLFQPFVSYGKRDGIGLGLAIGQKIFQDHGGDVCLESSKPGNTVFRLSLPILVSGDGILSV